MLYKPGRSEHNARGLTIAAGRGGAGISIFLQKGLNMSRRMKAAVVAAIMTTASAVMIAAPAANAGAGSEIGKITTKQVQLNWQPPRSDSQSTALKNQALAATPITDFTRSIKDGTSTFKYTMIGKNPFVAQATPSTTIKTYVQPVKIKFSDGKFWDPTVGNNCDPSSVSALKRTKSSPIFVSQAWKFGNKSVGTGQYVDATQRAGFFKQTTSTGLNPGYHVKLTAVTLPKITINVPNASAAEGSLSCGNLTLGAIDINYWDNLVRNTLLPNMASAGLTLKDFPLFLFGNVVMFNGNPGNCCILGYHSAKGSGGTFQSYGNSMYDATGAFTGSGDVSVLTHEISEWMDDPTGVNPTKPWGNIGQVSGCQANLETGDPLSGTVKTDALNGFTYHVQELAFYSWFYHQSPSQGVNGWYSNYGKFKTSAKPCP